MPCFVMSGSGFLREEGRRWDGGEELTFPKSWIAVSIKPARNNAIKMNVPSITHAGCNFFCASKMIIRITKKRVSEPTVTA